MRALPFVSIVSLNWNSGRDICHLFKSIYKSDYPLSKFEIIMVDNGSTDNSIDLVSQKFPKVKIISLGKNFGVWARNFAFKKAKGEIIVTLDSDAILAHKDSLRKIVEKLDENPDIGILGVKIINKKTKKAEYSPFHLNFYTGIISMLNPNLPTQNATWIPFIMSAFPKKVLKKAGLIKHLFFYGEDMNFCQSIKKSGLKISYWPDIFIYHNKSKTKPDVAKLNKFYLYYEAIFGNIWEFGNLLQKISVTVFQLLIIPPVYIFYFKKNPLIKDRFIGFWENIKKQSFETKILTLTFIFGVILRILTIFKRDFWFDEAFTYEIAKLPLTKLFPAVLTDNNPPLYYLIIHFMLKISQNKIIVRLPSLIFGLVSILAGYKVMEKIAGKKIALFSASLLSLSPLLIYFSSEARLHSLGMLLTLIITLTFLNLTFKPNFKNIGVFIFMAILGVYTQYYLFLLLVALTIIIIHKKQVSLKKWSVILLTVAIVFIPWLYLSSQYKHNGCACTYPLLSIPSVLVSPIIGGVGEFSLRFYPLLHPLTILLLGTISLFAFLAFLRGVSADFNLKTILTTPLLILSALGLFLPVFSPKAFSVFSPFYLVITAMGLIKFNRKKILLLFLFILAIVDLIEISNPQFQGTRVEDVSNLVRSDSTIPVVHSSLITFYSLDFYAQGSQKEILITNNPLSSKTLEFIGGSKEKLDESLNKFWFVDSKIWTEKQEYISAQSELFDKYHSEKTYNLNNIDVYLMSKN